MNGRFVAFSPSATRETLPCLTETEMLEKIREMAKACPGAQKGMASSFGLSPQYINDLVHGRRSITDRVAIHLGYRMVVIFVPFDSEEGA